jgi:alkylhydroperoxidase family enzyme
VRISILNESEYAIRAHSISASKKGASEEQIAGVKEFESGPFNENEKMGFRLADRLHKGGQQIDDAFYGDVKGAFEDTEIVELFLTAAAFEMFPRFIDGLRIPVTAMPAGK